MRFFSELQGKVAYITGGAGGIGRSIAEHLIEAGVRVAIVDIAAKKAQETARELGSDTIAVQCDVSDPDSVEHMISTIIETFGCIDIAINNAGIALNVPTVEMTYDQWERMLGVNLTGVFLCCQAVGKEMIKQKYGVIINTASMSAHVVNVPQPQVAYNASKAGVLHLTKTLAVEWAPYGIRVNSISPGYVGTEMTLAAPKEWKDRWVDLTPVKRMGRPEELGGAVLYLCSDLSSYTSGSDMIIDGGYTCI